MVNNPRFESEGNFQGGPAGPARRRVEFGVVTCPRQLPTTSHTSLMTRGDHAACGLHVDLQEH